MASPPHCHAIRWALGTLAVVSATGAGRGACRDPLRQPFASTSIWNTPIGSGAKLKPAGLFAGTPERPLPPRFHCDQDWFVVVRPGDPLVDVHAGYFGNCSVRGPVVGKMQLPRDFVTDCGPNNNAAAVLQGDGHTLLEFQPIYRGEHGGPVMGWFKPGNATAPLTPMAGDTCHGTDCDIRGNGTSGAHGGSQLSSLGGTIRLGELLPHTGPITHALKLELVASQYFWWQENITNYSTCWRWPARTCDGYAPARYRGTDPDLQPGSLLAVDVVRTRRRETAKQKCYLLFPHENILRTRINTTSRLLSLGIRRPCCPEPHNSPSREAPRGSAGLRWICGRRYRLGARGGSVLCGACRHCRGQGGEDNIITTTLRDLIFLHSITHSIPTCHQHNIYE
jgi:hypothetical protein